MQKTGKKTNLIEETITVGNTHEHLISVIRKIHIHKSFIKEGQTLGTKVGEMYPKVLYVQKLK